MAYIALDHVEKLYHVGEVTITAVSDISFTVDKGEFVVVVGPSGAGKTTVLNILGGMDRLYQRHHHRGWPDHQFLRPQRTYRLPPV